MHPLLQPLFEHRDALNGHLYFLLDAAASRRQPGELFRQVAPQYYVSLFEGSGNANEDIVDQAPYLVELTEPEGFARYLVKKADLRAEGFFIVAVHELELVAHHFKQYLGALLPDGNQVYFRFYDPRVALTLLDASTPDEVNLFLGPAESVYIARTPNPAVLDRYAIEPQLPRPAAEDPPWVMSERQDLALRIQALGDIPRRIAATLRAILPQHTASYDDKNLQGLALRAIQRAERYDIRRLPNVIGFAAAMLVFGAEFDETGTWYRPMSNPRQAEDHKGALLSLALMDTLQRHPAPERAHA